MAQSFSGTNGESGLAARAHTRGLPTPTLDPTLGTDDAGDGVLDLEAAPPSTDFLASIASFMGDNDSHVAPGQGNNLPLADPSVTDADVDEASGEQGATDAGLAPSTPHASEQPAPPAGPDAFGLPWLTAPEPPAEPPAAPEASTAGHMVIDGIAYSQDDLKIAIAAARQQSMMTPQMVDMINAVLTGRAQIVPAGSTSTPHSASPAGTNPRVAPSAPPADAWAYDPDDTPGQLQQPFIDPRVEQTLQTLDQRQQYIEQQQRAFLQERAAQQQLRENQMVERAMVSVTAQYGISEDMFDMIAEHAAPFVQHGFATAPRRPDGTLALDDNTPVYQYGIEQAIWAHPQLRQFAINAAAQQQIDGTGNELAEARKRRANASSLAGSPAGSVSRTPPAPRDPRGLTDQETRAGLTAALRAMEG